MIYLLAGLAVFALLVWVGRRARPMLEKREWRIAAGALSILTLTAGGFATVRGGWVIGLALIAAGLVMATSARRGAPPPGADNSDLAEARDILGVGVNATRAEIQAAYSRLIRAVHPDIIGGASGLAARLNAARDALLKKK
ncbi:MAG: J domain-containing protein [Caulobacter sp.]|nr:J domain-containing protein [Caulobacter sp.]